MTTMKEAKEEEQQQQIHQSDEESENQKSKIEKQIRRVMRRTNTTLPDDIIYYNILIRLPAKFLVRFRSVCKSWNYNLSTPEFVKAHFTLQQSVQDQDLLIGHRSSSSHGVIIITRSCEIPLTVGPLRTNILLGSINGLVCMASDSGTDFSLWNPATGQAKEISLPNHDRRVYLLGFSWDHVEDDYKVVIVSDVSSCSSKHLYIYSCRSACWNRLILPASDGSKLHHRFNAAPSTVVKGLPYWNYTKYGRRNRMRYVYFNVFAKDELRSLPRLYLNCSYLNNCSFNLVNIKDCLVGMLYKSKGIGQDTSVHMYSLDKKSDSGVWSKMCTIQHIHLRCYNWWHSKCFKNGGEILMVNNDELCFYDLETLETKSIIRSNSGSFKNCCSYTPSLESVHGMESMTVLPFQEMEMKKLAIENSNLVRSSSIPKSDSSSSTDTSSESEASESDSDAEKSSDSGTSSGTSTSESESDEDTN